jgi:hypothetical protein
MNKDQYTGLINFSLYAKGSKSESVRPVITLDTGIAYTLYREGDNPFTNESLLDFNGRCCSVRGQLDKSRMLIKVNSIEAIHPPGEEQEDEGEDSSPEGNQRPSTT